MKTKTILIAAVMVLGFSAAAYSQALYDVGSEIVTTAVESGCTEKVGTILFTTDKSTGPTVTGTITIDFKNPITYLGDVVVTADPDDTGTLPDVEVVGFSLGDQEVVLAITPDPFTPALYYGFRLEGVRINIAGDPTATPLIASISSTGNGISAGENETEVLRGQAPGIASFTGIGSAYKINAITGEYMGGGPLSLDVREGFRGAFSVALDTDPAQTNTQWIKIVLSQAVPVGASICFDSSSSDGHWSIATANCLTSGSGPAPYVLYQIIEDTDPVLVEDFVVGVDVSADYAGSSPYPITTIYAQATLAPKCDGFSSAIPRYVEVLTGNVAIVSFVRSSTTLMIPFATYTMGFNTAIGVANTTKDPGEGVMNFVGALPQEGAMTFYFYPQVGASFHYATTTGNPPPVSPDVINPLVNGLLPSGRTYTVLLSELLTAAGFPGLDFTGYIIIQCDFTNAHGQYYVTDWEAFTNGAQALVLNSDWVPVFADGEFIAIESPGRKFGTEGADH